MDQKYPDKIIINKLPILQNNNEKLNDEQQIVECNGKIPKCKSKQSPVYYGIDYQNVYNIKIPSQEYNNTLYKREFQSMVCNSKILT